MTPGRPGGGGICTFLIARASERRGRSCSESLPEATRTAQADSKECGAVRDGWKNGKREGRRLSEQMVERECGSCERHITAGRSEILGWSGGHRDPGSLQLRGCRTRG